ncbi:MAG: hypothetical protein M3308_02070 [Actinomycetota bacterium]|nr:hypothetical protein [Actinomycetota bacterium]
MLGSLAQARGGAQPLVVTLTAFFASGGVTAATARQRRVSDRMPAVSAASNGTASTAP